MMKTEEALAMIGGHVDEELLLHIMSSGNNRRLEAADKRFRASPSTEQTHSHLPGSAPFGALDGETDSAAWCGHSWGEWRTLPEEDRQTRAHTRHSVSGARAITVFLRRQ